MVSVGRRRKTPSRVDLFVSDEIFFGANERENVWGKGNRRTTKSSHSANASKYICVLYFAYCYYLRATR